MKRLINTKLFCLLREMDGILKICEQDMKSIYDDFIYNIIIICSDEKEIALAYFTIHYTYLELKQLRILLNTETLKTKSFVLSYINLSLSFLSVALEWTKHNPRPIVMDAGHITNTPPSGYYIWEGTTADLIELAIAFYHIKLIRKASGKLITFADIIHDMKLIFNIKIPRNIYSRKSRTMERKKNSSCMLERLLAVYKHEVDKFHK